MLASRPLLVAGTIEPPLSSWWLSLVVDVDTPGPAAPRGLDAATKVVVRDESIREIVPMRPVRRSRSAS